jgi:delta 1-pyrroline-5-carboxylate dehydrogenase
MGRFAGLGGIKTNQGGLYFLPGDYEVMLEEIKFFLNRKKQDTFVVAAKVLKSTCSERAPGCKPSQVIILKEDILETVMGNIKQFAGAVLGIGDPDSFVADIDPSIPEDTPEAATDRFWEETLESLVSDEQPAKGVVIKLNVTTIKTRENKDFNKHVWGPVVEVAA